MTAATTASTTRGFGRAPHPVEDSRSSDYFVARRASGTRRTPRHTGVLGQLNSEWAASLGTYPVPAAWSSASSLARFATLQEVLDAISRTASSQDIDAILHALLTLHRRGDQTAGRTVLQTMLGKVARTAHTARNRGLGDEYEAALAAMWSAIHGYPLHRTRSVAGNLALDALRQLERRAPEEVAVPQTWLTEAEGAQHIPAGSADEGFDTVLVQTLTWAADHSVLSPAQIKLLALAHLQTSGGFVARMTGLAEEMGVTFRCLQQRHQRAVTRLAAAVADAMWAPDQDGPAGAATGSLLVASAPLAYR